MCIRDRNYRIAYLGETMVNWCPQLGTVLANDEVVDGVSERGYCRLISSTQPTVSSSFNNRATRPNCLEESAAATALGV